MQLGDRFDERSATLRARYAEAKGGQWTVADLEWTAEAVVLAAHQPEAAARATRAALVATFYHWSDALLGATSRLAATLANADAQLLVAVHVHDHARHLECWRRYLECVGTAGQVPDGARRALVELVDVGEPARTLHAAAVRLPALQAAYAALADGWCCPLGRRLCNRLAGDTARQRDDLCAVILHAERGGGAALESETDVLFGLAPVLEPELGPDPVSALRSHAAEGQRRMADILAASD